MITATPFLAAAADAKLEDWGSLEEALPISGPISGGEPMHTWGTTLWTGEGAQEAGVWECTPGPSRWSLADNEFVHILSGRMTVTPDGGEPTEVGPGDTAVFPAAGPVPGRSTRRSASSTSCSDARTPKPGPGRPLDSLAAWTIAR
jgi:hypothetical protein